MRGRRGWKPGVVAPRSPAQTRTAACHLCTETLAGGRPGRDSGHGEPGLPQEVAAMAGPSATPPHPHATRHPQAIRVCAESPPPATHGSRRKSPETASGHRSPSVTARRSGLRDLGSAGDMVVPRPRAQRGEPGGLGSNLSSATSQGTIVKHLNVHEPQSHRL